MDKYFKPRKCPVCGQHRGVSGPDHSECSKIMQQRGDNKRSKATKTMTEKQINDLLKYIEGKDDAI